MTLIFYFYNKHIELHYLLIVALKSYLEGDIQTLSDQ